MIGTGTEFGLESLTDGDDPAILICSLRPPSATCVVTCRAEENGPGQRAKADYAKKENQRSAFV